MCSALALLVLESCGPYTPEARVATTPTPTPAAITLRADQMILPPEQFPTTGYHVALDEPAGAEGWRRNFELDRSREYRVQVLITVTSQAKAAELRAFLESDAVCNASVVDVTTALPTTPFGLGDVDRLCVYTMRDGELQLAHRALLRNAMVESFVSIYATGSDGARAMGILDAVARTQMEIIARLTPGAVAERAVECPLLLVRDFTDAIRNDIAAWDDLERLAGVTARIALSPVVQRMQDARRNVAAVPTYGCMATARAALVDYMDVRLQIYLGFMAQGEILDGRRISEAKFGAYTSAMQAISRRAR